MILSRDTGALEAEEAADGEVQRGIKRLCLDDDDDDEARGLATMKRM